MGLEPCSMLEKNMDRSDCVQDLKGKSMLFSCSHSRLCLFLPHLLIIIFTKSILSILFCDLQITNLRISAFEIDALNSYFPPWHPSDLHRFGCGEVPCR